MLNKKRKYLSTPKGKACKARYDAKYYASEKGKQSSSRAHAKYAQTPKGKWSDYRKSAKIRGHEFELSFEQFMLFWQKPCHYCGDPIVTVGLDRVENEKGYSVENIVPCCELCNKGKLEMSQEEYVAHCKKVVERFSRR